MAADFWLSFGLGAGLGVLYGVAGYATNRKAVGAGEKQFLVILFGGLMVRMFAALVLLTVILVTAPVREGVVAGSFVAVLAAAIGLEVWSLHRRRRAAPAP